MSDDNRDLTTGVAIALAAACMLAVGAISLRVAVTTAERAAAPSEFPFCARAVPGASVWAACKVKP